MSTSATPITPVDEWTAAVLVPKEGSTVQAADVVAGIQPLANRVEWLANRAMTPIPAFGIADVVDPLGWSNNSTTVAVAGTWHTLSTGHGTGNLSPAFTTTDTSTSLIVIVDYALFPTGDATSYAVSQLILQPSVGAIYASGPNQSIHGTAASILPTGAWRSRIVWQVNVAANTYILDLQAQAFQGGSLGGSVVWVGPYQANIYAVSYGP